MKIEERGEKKTSKRTIMSESAPRSLLALREKKEKRKRKREKADKS